MRYFFSSGEPSGELAAVLLAQAVRRIDPQAQFEGIGAARMREAGFTIYRDHTGWATVGPFAVIPRLPKVILAGLLCARHIARTKPDALVLIDFGGFNLRLAKLARGAGYRGAIVDVFPPGAWLDSARTARTVTSAAFALSAFAHQRDFYQSQGLPVAYFGHPLAGQYAPRPPRAAPPPGGGSIALLPGSRHAELRYHVPLLFAAYRELRRIRPDIEATIGAADERLERELRAEVAREKLDGVRIVRGTREAIAQADAAWVASGTAVLECALSGVPAVAFYIVSPSLARYARRRYSRPYYTLPNLVLEREMIPELMQERATPSNMARAMDALLNDPAGQYADFQHLREALGPPDALERCAAFIVAAAGKAA